MIGPVKIPPTIGKYKFRGTIGEGAFSAVKLVVNMETNEYFAAKIIPRERVRSANLEERFETEIRIDQQLHHPGIVQIVDLLKDNENFYVMMEFCPNGDFFQFIVDSGKLQENVAAYFIRQVLQALKYVHSLGIAHRDLKPENLLLDSQNNLKISDFGLSRYVGQQGLVETPCGSPCYASPECLSGAPYDGCKSDIWSCGVILFAALTGQLPWTKRNQQQLFEQIKRGEYKVPNFVTPEGKDFLQGLMTVDLDKRLTIDQALNHPWMKQAPPQKANFRQQPVNIVSLKQVDRFFDAEVETDIPKVPEPKSTRQQTFMQTVQSISATKKKLPSLKSRVTNIESITMKPRRALSRVVQPSKPLSRIGSRAGTRVSITRPIRK